MSGKNTGKSEEILSDPRFASMYTDARFARAPRQTRPSAAPATDERFEDLFEDVAQNEPTINVRGEPINAELPTDEEVDALEYASSEEEQVPLPATTSGSIETETARLAVTDLPWTQYTADDVYMILSSGVPAGAELLSVKVFESDFGHACLAIEETQGPVIIDPETMSVVHIKRTTAAAAAADPGLSARARRRAAERAAAADEADVAFVRRYEQQRRRYAFAVAEFSSAACALAVYAQLDGMHVGAAALALSFVPAEVTVELTAEGAPRRVLSVCTAPPAVHAADATVSGTLAGTSGRMAWGTENETARRVLLGRMSAEELDRLDNVEEILAMSDEEDEDEDTEAVAARQAAYRAMLEEAAAKEAVSSTRRGTGLVVRETVAEAGSEGEEQGTTAQIAASRLMKQRMTRLRDQSETAWDRLARLRAEKAGAKAAAKAAAATTRAEQEAERRAAVRAAAGKYRGEAEESVSEAEAGLDEAVLTDSRFASALKADNVAFANDRAALTVAGGAVAEKINADRFDSSAAAQERAAAARAAAAAVAAAKEKKAKKTQKAKKAKKH